jgi:predicted NBD/HSP70 family sugar kinase
MHIIVVSAAVGAAMMSIGPTAFAQASSPVSSSVFIHRSFDTGNNAVNENFQYIAHPPMRPVAASEPAVARGAHRGRRGQTGTTGSGTNDTGAAPRPQMPTDASSNASVSQ